MNVTPKIIVILTSLSILAVSGCGSNQTRIKKQPEPLLNKANQLFQAEDYTAAATLYRRLSEQRQGRSKKEYQLKAADALVRASNYVPAKQLLLSINTEDKSLRFYKHVLLAEIAMSEENYPLVLKLMSQPAPSRVSRALIRRQIQTKAHAYRLSGNLLRGARELSALDLLLRSPQERLQNQVALLRTLSVIDATTLSGARATPGGNFAGWLAMAQLVQQFGIQPSVLQPHLLTWRQRYRSHPAMPNVFDNFQQDRELVEFNDLGRVAVLLPSQGRLAQAASVLRDGILAAYHHQQSQQSAELVFYDTSSTDIVSLYQQAVNEGADLVLGPLEKQAVVQLAQLQRLPVPLISLNLLPANVPAPHGMFQFGLSPEDEARQVAERAWLDGYSRATVLAPQGAWGNRLLTAFQQHFILLGGDLVGETLYDPSLSDFGQPIKQLLMLEESIARKNAMQKMMGKRLHFTPRIRQDTDFIFMIAKTRQARQIRPQLQFHYAGDLPVYATSHSFSGLSNPQLDIDLEGIRFIDLPWLLVATDLKTEVQETIQDDPNNPNNPNSQDSLNSQETMTAYASPKSLGPYRRIYAMGIDAFSLLSQLDNLQTHQGATQEGKTGLLYLGKDNKIQRMMVWAQIRQGRPELLGYSPTYALTPNAFNRQIHPEIQGEMNVRASQ